MPYSWPLPSRRKNSPACVPPVTSISSSMPAWTSASTAYVTIGRSYRGSRCLFVIRVSGCRRVPEPPARMTPFMGRDGTRAARHAQRRGAVEGGGGREEAPLASARLALTGGRGARGRARSARPSGRRSDACPAPLLHAKNDTPDRSRDRFDGARKPLGLRGPAIRPPGGLPGAHPREAANGGEPGVERQSERAEHDLHEARHHCFNGSPEWERGTHGRATQEPRRPPGRDPGALRRHVAGARIHGPPSRLPAPVRLLPHRRSAGAAHRARAAGRGSRLRAARRHGPFLHRLGPARAPNRARRALSADGDRIRPLPTAHRARRRRRPGARDRALRARAPADRPSARRAGHRGDDDRDRGAPVTESELVDVSPDEQQHAQELGQELPTTLPVLPLKETVVFPESMTPLAIGQERSIKLIDDVVGGDRLLALVTVRNPEAEGPGWDDLYEVGTAAVVHKMMGVPDGTLRILVQGLRRIRIERRVADDPYLVAEFVELPDHVEATKELEALTRNVQSLFGRIIALVPYLPEELQLAAANVDDPSALSALVVSTLRLKAEEKQKLLELVDVEKRLREVSAILNRELEVFELGTKIQSQVQSEMEKGQREFFLRQQMKAIQTELGEGDPEQAELEELRGRIGALELPEEAEKAARRELSRLERLPAAAAEYGVIRTYLDWIATLPWNKTTEDKIDLP